MLRLSVRLGCLLPIAAVASVAMAEPSEVSSDPCRNIEGVWSIESMDVGLGDASRTTKPEAFLFFFAKKHYSAIRDLATAEGGTDGEPARSFMADAGTYEFNGDDLVVKHMVAGFPVLGSMTFGCRMEDGDTLVLTPQYDKMVMPGLDIKPTEDGKMGYGDVATRYVFKRLE